ncbi:hypothetical protein B0I35DRAFT_485435 [Stachybotrys elegans]|uniref:Uncharacterized protein n=1 Tax=Stachybotrys elegans TaxID=80388 RepID=A0A8K0WJM1_9HYPO|nr:hypothetical protein B0I35DRAFT_485435 [Stachybotrys elegans]
MFQYLFDLEQARSALSHVIDAASDDEEALHGRPELGCQEVFAHASLTAWLEARGFRVTPSAPYKELRVNEALCGEYLTEIAALGNKVLLMDDQPSAAGTDMGNVSHNLPSLHSTFAITTVPDVPVHHSDFALASGSMETHLRQR